MRAVFSFQIGIWMYMAIGFVFTFAESGFFLMAAVLLMLWSVSRERG
jgi:hypothetical protein